MVLPVYMPLRLVFGGEPEVGKSYVIRTFDPLLLKNIDVSVSIVNDSVLLVPDSAAFDSTSMRWVAARWDTVMAWQVKQKVNGVSADAWIDHLGRVVSVSSPLGFTIKRSAFELAFNNFQNRDRSLAFADFEAADIIQQTAIASNVDLSVERRELRVVRGGIDPEGFDLAGGRQALAGDTLIVTIRRPVATQRKLRPRDDAGGSLTVRHAGTTRAIRRHSRPSAGTSDRGSDPRSFAHRPAPDGVGL